MDTQTRHALKGDKFAQATKTSVNWVSENRSGVVRWAISVAVVVVICLGAGIFYVMRSSAADTALGAAMDTYAAPLAEPGAPAQKGIYATAGERSKAANQQFVAVAQQFGWLPDGAKAHYFAGVTYADLGQNGQAETELNKAAGSWNHGVANLAKIALAGLYHQTGRDPQAIDLYNAVIAKPSVTVPGTSAQLSLAELYVEEGKQDQARAIWAKVEDSDKTGAAGEIATQKLTAGKQ